ncbi:adenylyltransferase/cytidyltransferase family protein [Companilactobacillus nodensis]|uniref:adenylyltransferase/cytidyltransferase family protein n=1 Tax=Companilactobacillus nodensis TaxID=460870 RepID=UPI0006868E6A|nr:adenylyltransferase/cytidyltransferase family protein [Companilactobacillus nodensis]
MTDRVGIYAGSFDPVTNGHLDIIRRSSKLFDKLIVATMTNTSKNYMFTYEEKKKFIEDEITDLSNVEVIDGNGQLTTKLLRSTTPIS